MKWLVKWVICSCNISRNSKSGYSRGRDRTKECLTSHKTKASTPVKCVRLIDQSRSGHQKARPCERNLGIKVVIGDIHHVFRRLTLQVRRPLLSARKTPVGGTERTLWIQLTYRETKSCGIRCFGLIFHLPQTWLNSSKMYGT